MEAAFAARKAGEPLKLNVPKDIDESATKKWARILQEHNDYTEKLRDPGREFSSQFSSTVTLLILSTWMGLGLMLIPVKR
jgi:hypothetical protein